jgi:hypothetical protein
VVSQDGFWCTRSFSSHWNTVELSYKAITYAMEKKSGLIQGVASLEGDNLVVFHFLTAPGLREVALQEDYCKCISE